MKTPGPFLTKLFFFYRLSELVPGFLTLTPTYIEAWLLMVYTQSPHFLSSFSLSDFYSDGASKKVRRLYVTKCQSSKHVSWVMRKRVTLIYSIVCKLITVTIALYQCDVTWLREMILSVDEFKER